MRDETGEQGVSQPQPALSPRRAPISPSSSRMFASYLNDIEQLLKEEHWDHALCEALDVPRLAVALADPSLRCSGGQVRSWCEEWLRPRGAERDAQGLDVERLLQRLSERLPAGASDSVPTRALRRLQLRRHLRAPPRGFFAIRADQLHSREAETLEMCSLLIEAGRRWYARSACHDPIVQANLARLAVLR